MKLTKQIEVEILQAYNNFWEANLSANMEVFASYLVDDFSIIGSANGEVFFNKQDTVKFYTATADQLRGKAQLRNRDIGVQSLDNNSVVIREESDLYVLIGNEWTFYGHARISCIVKHTDDGWKAVHQHASFPDHRTEEGQQLASEKIEKENLELREAVKRRTVELESKTRELEIESSLERVRAVAMGMRKPGDMLEVCHAIAQQLELLKVKDIRNVQTAIFYESKGTYVNYEYYAKHDKLLITEVDYKNHEIQSLFANQMLTGAEELFTIVLKGKELTDWYNYQKTTNQFVDVYLENAHSLNYHWYSLGPVALGISTYSPLADEEINLFKRFRNVFELAYKRFVDIEKAEAQAREAKIEVALERVRARTMAMQHSDELADASFVLDSQVRGLGIQTHGCAFNIYGESDSEEWFSSEIGAMPKYRTPRENLFLRYYEAGKNGAQIHIEEYAGDRCKTHYEYLCTIPGMGDGLREMIKAGGSFPTRQIDHVVYFKYGYLLFITLQPVPEAHEAFIRFTKVFEQTYTRFLDLQKAEAQTREAQIEASLERVRSKAMAMHNSQDLADTIGVFYKELHTHSITPRRCGVGLLSKENKEGELFTWNTTEQGESLELVGKIKMEGHPVLENVYNGWLSQIDYHPILRGNEIKEYYKVIRPMMAFPDYDHDTVQYGHFFFFKEGGVYAWTDTEMKTDELDIYHRFTSVLSLTYKRYKDLQQAEAFAKQAEQDLINLKAEKQKTEDALSELKATQAQLIQSEKMASLGELTAGIAHEIQNPLNFVNNFSEVSGELVNEMNDELQKGNTDDAKQLAADLKQNLEKINHHGKRAGDIVKGMLQHSRTSSGVKELTDINTLVDEYLRLAYHGLKAKDKSFNAKFETRLDTTLPKINIIPQDMGRVILNLINNAFYAVSERNTLRHFDKLSTQGDKGYEPTVIVTTKKVDDSILISVQDNGNGIPERIKDKIFQPFFTTKPTGQGTGLGLSLAYDIVKTHGGELRVETKDGVGSIFIIQLPTK